MPPFQGKESPTYMKIKFLTFLIFFFVFPAAAMAQNSNLWLLQSNRLKPIVPVWGIQVPSASLASTSPWGLLSVNPDALGSGVPEFVVGSSTRTHFVIDGGGNVGIGTASPVDKLTVQTTSGNITASFIQTGAGTSEGAGMVGYADNGAAVLSGNRLGYFALGGATDASHTYARPLAITGFAAENFTGSAAGSDMRFETAPIGSQTRQARMTITANGNVGIGTTSPVGRLHVSSGGNATTTVSFGLIGDTTSKTCFNTKNLAGNDISFYFLGTSMIVESNLCK